MWALANSPCRECLPSKNLSISINCYLNVLQYVFVEVLKNFRFSEDRRINWTIGYIRASRRSTTFKSPQHQDESLTLPSINHLTMAATRMAANMVGAPRVAIRRFHHSAPLLKQQNRLPAAYYRGGTSRAVFFRQGDLPADRTRWDNIFRGVIGSPDPNGRQLDGMGGGLSSLSKVCVVGPSSREDADVDYTFVAIGVKNPEVDFSSNCGNMTSAVGPFAVDSGLFRAADGNATVRIHNTNTGKIIHAKFPVNGSEAEADGDLAIDGVAGTGAKIQLAFLNPS